MLPTLRQVLAMPVLAASDLVVHATEEQLDRPIRWLHPAEVADIAHLLRGDELVLLTGIDLPNDAVGMAGYVRSLVGVGCAGLIIELGRTWTVAPEPLVSACAEHGLALVVLHREVPFVVIVEEVGARILQAEMDDLRASEHIHETFTRLDLEIAGPEQILAATTRLATVPVVLESLRRQVIAYDPGDRSVADVLADWRRRCRSTTLTGRTAYDRRSGCLMTIVGSRGNDWGRLILLTDAPPRRRDYVLVERAAAALALYELRSSARDGVERGTHQSLLTELRSGHPSAEAVARCEALGFPVHGRKFVAVAARPHLPQPGRRGFLPSDLVPVLIAAARSHRLPILAGSERDQVLALLSMPSEADLAAVLTAVSGEVRRTVEVLMACGEEVGQVDDVRRTLADASHVLAVVDPDESRPWVTLADMHLKGLLHLLGDDDRLANFARRELGPLVAYDAERGASLVDLLRVYLETPGGKAPAAKKLLLSRPALYERLAKIEAVLGVDLEDPYIRTSLHVALLATDSLPGASSRPII